MMKRAREIVEGENIQGNVMNPLLPGITYNKIKNSSEIILT